MLSVLIATHNGADSIDQTLAAMSQLDSPADGWELVVVNNASTDETKACILRWQDRLPLKYVFEPRLGKSIAINSGLGHTIGDLILMTDDDVLPDRDWLTEWRRAAEGLPQCAIFGGTITPEFGANPPVWPMPEWCLTVLYGLTPQYPEGEIPPINVSGANMAIRRSVFDGGSRLNEGFLIGKNGLMGEDSEFVKRLWEEGHKVGFVPSARIRHIISPEQTSWFWMQKRFVRHGRTMFMLHEVRRDEKTGRPVFRFPWRRLRTALGSAVRLAMAWPGRDGAELFRQSHALAYDIGALRQAVSLLAKSSPAARSR